MHVRLSFLSVRCLAVITFLFGQLLATTSLAQVNTPPVISGSPVTSIKVGQLYSFTPAASDADGNRLAFIIQNKPAWLSFNSSTGSLSGTPTSAAVGAYSNITIIVQDGINSTALASFAITVTASPTNIPPVISGSPSTTVTVGSLYSFQPTASDANGDSLSFVIQNKPTWLSFSSTTGRLSGTPTAAAVGSYSNIIIMVRDGANSTGLAPFAITVRAPTNTPPVISGSPSTSVVSGSLYSFQPTASDANGDSLSFIIQNKPAWLSFNSSTGRLSGTPTSAAVGIYSNIIIIVRDGTNSTGLAPFAITVTAPINTSPVILGSPSTSITVGGLYSFQPAASDANGDSLSFVIQNKPAWLNFNSSTGNLSGTPTSAAVGTYSNIIIIVSDGKSSTGLAPFTITVAASAVNRPPVISGSPATSVKVGQLYSFTPVASDADGNRLSFIIQNKPTWLSFNSSTGSLSGTPTSAAVGAYSNIIIIVQDGTNSTGLASFSVTVTATANTLPAISGLPSASVSINSAYTFQPLATDADGDVLTFSITNKPSWVVFNSATGQLSGTPSSVHVGAYSGITINVSDGNGSTSLPIFSITVNQISLGSATLSWTPPTQNTDASVITDLAGYKIYYGTSATALTQSIQINSVGLSTYVINNLSPSTYYFAVSAFTASGAESAQSSVVSKVVN